MHEWRKIWLLKLKLMVQETLRTIIEGFTNKWRPIKLWFKILRSAKTLQISNIFRWKQIRHCDQSISTYLNL